MRDALLLLYGALFGMGDAPFEFHDALVFMRDALFPIRDAVFNPLDAELAFHDAAHRTHTCGCHPRMDAD